MVIFHSYVKLPEGKCVVKAIGVASFRHPRWRPGDLDLRRQHGQHTTNPRQHRQTQLPPQHDQGLGMRDFEQLKGQPFSHMGLIV